MRVLIFRDPAQDNFHRTLAKELARIAHQAKVQIETRFPQQPNDRIKQIYSYDVGAYRYPYYGRRIPSSQILRKALITSMLMHHYNLKGLEPNHAAALSNYYADKIIEKYDEAKQIFAKQRKKDDPYGWFGQQRIMKTLGKLIGEKIPETRKEAVEKVRKIFKNKHLEENF